MSLGILRELESIKAIVPETKGSIGNFGGNFAFLKAGLEDGPFPHIAHTHNRLVSSSNRKTKVTDTEYAFRIIIYPILQSSLSTSL
jgi:hypothetical protein